MADPEKRLTILPVAICFVLSGFAALLYETVWLREFAISFGTSEQALAIVLGSYMGGLALGAIVAAKFEHRLRRPLWVYGLLELGIAITAIAVPYILSGVRGVQVALFSSADHPPEAAEFSQIVFALLGAIAATILPTTMMGATLPMLAKHVVADDDQLGPRIGLLYALNTLGAVVGTLVAAFVLLPSIGLRQTVYVGAGINVLIFLVVWRLLPTGTASTTAELAERAAPPAETSPRGWILAMIGVSGGVSFAYEVLFTRMLGHFLGGSVFAFATMLAAFLSGLTIGGAIAARFAKRASVARVGFVYVQCATAALALLSWYGLESFASSLNAAALKGDAMNPWRPVIAMIVLLPPAIAIGMSFPFAVRIHARSSRDAATSAAKVYACSTVGGVLGSLLIGYVILPSSNYQLTATGAMATSLMVAAMTLLFGGLRPLHCVPLVGVAALLAVAFPRQPDEVLSVSPFDGVIRNGELAFVKTGRSATVTLFDNVRSYEIYTGGLPEARTLPKGALPRPKGASNWLGALPTLLRPNAESMLIVGFGSGMAALNASTSLASIDIFELEEGIIDANRHTSRWRQTDPLADRRVNVILNDGRSGLALTTRNYDVIVSQPSHPWTAGASHLYTRQYAQLALDHLSEDGVLVLWVDANHLDADLFRSMGATLLDVFPSVHLFRPNETSLLFVGFKSEWSLPCYLPTLASEDDQTLQELGVQTAVDLHAIRGLSDAQLRSICEGATINTDNHNRLALRRLPRDRTKSLAEVRDLISNAQQESGAACDLSLNQIARRRYVLGQKHNAYDIAQGLADEATRLATQGFFAEYDDRLSEAAKLYGDSLAVRPTTEALFGMYAVSRALG
ncbi:MAG: fused MFS/spermidine synthase, partial [Planctomycetota bacterium]